MLEPPDKELKDKYDKLHGKINTSNPYLW
jgi:hypothetical protein